MKLLQEGNEDGVGDTQQVALAYDVASGPCVRKRTDATLASSRLRHRAARIRSLTSVVPLNSDSGLILSLAGSFFRPSVISVRETIWGLNPMPGALLMMMRLPSQPSSIIRRTIATR